MALLRAWWMQEDVVQESTSVIVNPAAPHRTWPWNLPSIGLSFHTLERILRDSRDNTECSVYRFNYNDFKWKLQAEHKEPASLVEELKDDAYKQGESTIFVTLNTCPEVIQALGYYLKITPRFYNTPYMGLSSGDLVTDYAFFSLQYMDMYRPGLAPHESTRHRDSPSAQFDLGFGPTPYTWRITRVAVIYWTTEKKEGSCDQQQCMGVIQLDPADEVIFRGLCKLMTRNESSSRGEWELRYGMGQVLSEAFHIVAHNWGVFLDEAEQHLQTISRTVATLRTTHDQQKAFSLALHQLTPLWVDVRRLIVNAKDAVHQMVSHPFFLSLGGQESIKSYLKKISAILNDHEKRTEELDKNTNVLINLIFNLATFTDTAVAIEESKSANSVARSMHRAAVLTFFYLPLQIAASIYGMNVRDITGEGSHGILEFVFLSLALMSTTFLVWFVWSKVLSWPLLRRTRSRLRECF